MLGMKKGVTLSIDLEIWERYKSLCGKNNIIPSGEVESFMKEKIKDGRKRS